jgi:uncharacterized protein
MTEQRHVVIDLRSLDLASGAGSRRDVEVPVEPITIAGQVYVVLPQRPLATVDLSRSASGWFFRLRTSAEAVGPCSRCLEEARIPIDVDAREFAATGRDADAEFDEDFDSEYLTADRLDVSSWVRDCVADSLPAVVLCRDECAGICPTCGANLNDGRCDCPREKEIDPRWAALSGLAEQLQQTDRDA